MNYKNILFLFMLSLSSISFAVDHIFNLEFMKLCDAEIESEQKKSSIILRGILNKSNYLDVISWMCSKEYSGISPIVYAIMKENLFAFKELVSYITYDPNKQRPFNYTNGSISEHVIIARKIYDPILVESTFLKQCSLGNIEFIAFLCYFFSKQLTQELIMGGIIKATENNKKSALPILTDYLVALQCNTIKANK